MKYLFKYKGLNIFALLTFILGFNSTVFAGGGCFCSDPATALPVLSAISGVTATGGTATWTAAAHCGGITGYRVEVSLTSGGAAIGGYPLDLGVVLTSGLTGLTCNTTYFVRVRGELNAACGVAFTGYSNIRSFTTSACVAGTCTDGIKNGTEVGIDCGGTCPACIVSCNDGLQNGAETGVDCGGACPITCTTNTTLISSEDPCDGTSIATVYATNCDQVGTSAYNVNSPNVQFESDAVALPSSGFNCTAYSGATVTPAISEGTLAILNLDAGVDNVYLSEANLTALALGNSQTYVAAYQGNSCGTLTFVGCQSIVEKDGGSYFYATTGFSGLDDTKDLYLYTFNSSGKTYTIDFQIVGSTTITSNVTCATAAPASGEGCNLGAPGASWTPPDLPGAATSNCGGGFIWSSNDNTTYYSFTADATTGSLEIDNVSCNAGTSGNAQFGVWTSCAAIGTYGAGFLGCQVGTAPLSLSPLVDGQTYYIAVDGSGGDNCVWNFSGTGIILPIEYDYLTAEHLGDKVTVNWATASEKDNAFFTIQRTLDGRLYEDIGQVTGAGSSNERIEYSFDDHNPYFETSFYRIKQTDFDGQYKYSDIRTVNSKVDKMRLIPNPADEETKLNFTVRRAQNVNVKIVDITGMVVFEQTIQAIKGMNNTSIDLSTFSKGVYSVMLVTNDEVSTEKLSIY